MEKTLTTTNELYFGPFIDKRVAVFHVNKKRRNLFFTVTDLTGAVVGSISTKLFVKDRKKRTAPHIIESVSYTHLDVYKRQPYLLLPFVWLSQTLAQQLLLLLNF